MSLARRTGVFREALERVREAISDQDECEAEAIIRQALADWRGEG